MAKILILGGGFAGLVTAERLADRVGKSHQVTLVAPTNKFTFYPALVQVAFNRCEVEDISWDLGQKLKEKGVRFVRAAVTRINGERKTVEVVGDDLTGEIGYDLVVIAIGRRLATEQVPGFREYAHHLLGPRAAHRFGDAVREFERGRIVLGLCPDGRLPVPVCEAAFALAKMYEQGIKAGDTHITVIFPDSLEGSFGGARLHSELEAAFARHGVNVLYDVPITEVTADAVYSAHKHAIAYDLLMLVPPFRGPDAFTGEDFADAKDFVKVNDLMQVIGLEKGYAAGDAVAFSGPKFAHMAVRQAETAVNNIILELEGKEPAEHYYHEIATIIDAGGADSIYLHYGIWDDWTYRLKQGRLWGWAKDAHDAWWQARNR